MAQILNEPPAPNKEGRAFMYREVTDEAVKGSGGKRSVNNDDFLGILRRAIDSNENYLAEIMRRRWDRSVRAYRSQHFSGSKYLDPRYKGRSSIFRPKTRAAARKSMAAAAAALMSTDDVVSVKAEYEDDERAQASAKVVHELLNYRLDRTSTRGGIPWFLTAMGANLDAQVHGICISKQSWEYETVKKQQKSLRSVPAVDENGIGQVDPTTGMEVMTTEEFTDEVEEIIKDRPMIYIIPPENVVLDLASPWYAPVQGSAFFSVRYPMLRDDIEARIDADSTGIKGGGKWIGVNKELLVPDNVTDDGSNLPSTIRRAREDQRDRYDQDQQAIDPGLGVIWVYENFIRRQGVDYHFWSIGSRGLLSDVIETREAYPAHRGERPYAMGYGSIETHDIYPTSPVESWQPLQQEANDLTNLRLDVIKQGLAPIALVKRGTQFDLQALKNRGGPETTVLVNNVDDIAFPTIPGVRGEAFTESNLLNADFDDLSGTFSQGSVQTNRQMNETVGGMRLLSGSANAVTEFDLRVWVETWVEVALRQIVHLEQFYESDETVIAVAGQRAKIWEKYGQSAITDEMLTREVNVKVNVGIGATDPMARISKLGAAIEMGMKVAEAFDKPVKIRAEEFLPEIMGAAGYKDGMRFFNFEPQQDTPPELQVEMEKLKLQKLEIGLKYFLARMANDAKMDQTVVSSLATLLGTTISSKNAVDLRTMDITAQQIEMLLSHGRASQEAEDEKNFRSAEMALAGGGGEPGPEPSPPGGPGPPAPDQGGPPGGPMPGGPPPGPPPGPGGPPSIGASMKPGAGGPPPGLADMLGGG